MQQSKLDLVVAGTREAVLMVESEADRLSEEVMLGAVVFGHEQMQMAIKAIKSLAAEAGKPQMAWAAAAEDTELIAGCREVHCARSPRPTASPRSRSVTPRSARSRSRPWRI